MRLRSITAFYFFDNINTNTFPGPYTIEMAIPTGFSVVETASAQPLI
ncbi:hypothetical protein [Chryseobacterium indoltheticum]